MERRKYPRFELKVSAKYRVVSSDKVLESGKTKDISAEGICFESDKELEIGSYVNMGIDLCDDMAPVSLVGEVKWSRKVRIPDSKEEKYLNGVKLVDIPKTDEERFLKYYCGRMVEKLAGYLKIGG